MYLWNVSVPCDGLIELDLTPGDSASPGRPAPAWLAANLERLGIEATLDRIEMRGPARCRYVSSYPEEDDWRDRWPWTWTLLAHGEVHKLPKPLRLIWAKPAAFFETVAYSEDPGHDPNRSPDDGDEVLILGATRLPDERLAAAIEDVDRRLEAIGVNVEELAVRRFEPRFRKAPDGMAELLARLGPAAGTAQARLDSDLAPLRLLRLRLSDLRFPEGLPLAEAVEAEIEAAGFLSRHLRVDHELSP